MDETQSKELIAGIRFMTAHKLSPREGEVLLYIIDGVKTAKELSTVLHLSASSIQSLLNRLRSKGVILPIVVDQQKAHEYALT